MDVFAYIKRMNAADKTLNSPSINKKDKAILEAVLQKKYVGKIGSHVTFLVLFPIGLFKMGILDSKRHKVLKFVGSFVGCIGLKVCGDYQLDKWAWGNIEGIVQKHYKEKEEEYYTLSEKNDLINIE